MAPSQAWAPRTPTAFRPPRRPPTAPTIVRTNYSGQYGKIDDLSEEVFELILLEPDERLRGASFALIDALNLPGKPASRNAHWLCRLFEEVAIGLQALIAAPGTAIDELVSDTLSGSKVLSAAVRAVLKHATEVALAPTTAPLRLLHMKVCVCALAFCPNMEKHRSLEKNCGVPALNESLYEDGGAERGEIPSGA